MTRRGGLIALTALMLPALVALLGLGTWQMQRLAWKEDLIAHAASRAGAAPVALVDAVGRGKLTPQHDEFTRVRFAATFIADEAHVYTHLPDAKGPLKGPGYWVFQPARLDDGKVIVINRGFVPEGRRDPASRDGPLGGEMAIEGLIRFSEVPSRFLPANQPEKNIWQARDIALIARDKGWGEVAPIHIDLFAPVPVDGLPQPGETRLVFKNDHLGYALTWYGLACTLVGVWGAYVWGALRRRRDEATVG